MIAFKPTELILCSQLKTSKLFKPEKLVTIYEIICQSGISAHRKLNHFFKLRDRFAKMN